MRTLIAIVFCATFSVNLNAGDALDSLLSNAPAGTPILAVTAPIPQSPVSDFSDPDCYRKPNGCAMLSGVYLVKGRYYRMTSKNCNELIKATMLNYPSDYNTYERGACERMKRKHGTDIIHVSALPTVCNDIHNEADVDPVSGGPGWLTNRGRSEERCNITEEGDKHAWFETIIEVLYTWDASTFENGTLIDGGGRMIKANLERVPGIGSKSEDFENDSISDVFNMGMTVKCHWVGSDDDGGWMADSVSLRVDKPIVATESTGSSLSGTVGGGYGGASGGVSGGISSQEGINRAIATKGKPGVLKLEHPFPCSSDEGVMFNPAR